MKRMLGLVLVLMLMVCSLAYAEEQLPVLPGYEAPEFEITQLDGEIFRLSEHRGKVVIVNIWATWCPPCVAEMPDLEQISVDYAEDVVVIGVSSGETEEEVAEFVQEHGYTYRFAADTDYLVSGTVFPSYAIPYTVVIDPEGVITTTHMGLCTYEQFEEFILAAMPVQSEQIEILA